MVPRQVWLFQLGCWMALATSIIHLVAHITGPLTSGGLQETELNVLLPMHVWAVPGLRQPTFSGMLDGFSLSVAMLTATIGAAGLIVVRQGQQAATLARYLARVFAVGFAACLAVSVSLMFSVESFFLATVAMCFGLASVTPE